MRYRGGWGLVTGASAGLGAEFADALARRGMNLVLTARREARLRELASGLRAKHGVEVEVVVADLALPGAATTVWSAATHGHAIDLLVNNAGFGAEGELAEIPIARQVEMVQVNCIAVLELAYLAVRDMVPRGSGGIINLSSIAAFQPVPRLATYAASKAFVLSLSAAIHAELGSSGVRALALCPGRTPTEFQAVAGTGTAEKAFGARSPAFVVEQGLRALDGRGAYLVPGLENHLTSVLVRILPRSIVTRALERLVRRAAATG